MLSRPSGVIAAGCCLALTLGLRSLAAEDRPSWTAPFPGPTATAPVVAIPAAAKPVVSPTTAPGIHAPTDPRVFLTVDQLWQAFREKQFNLVAHEIYRIYEAPKIEEGYDKYELLTLRGETQLQLRNIAGAMEFFKASQAAAPDDAAKALAAARQVLAQHQIGMVYKPRTAGSLGLPSDGAVPASASIDILDLDQRPAAYKALYQDELAAALPELGKISKITTVAAISSLARRIDTLWQLELTVTGKHVEIGKYQAALVHQTRDILTKFLKENAARVDNIEAAADVTHTVSVGRTDETGQIVYDDVEVKAGLSQQGAAALREIGSTMSKYARAVDDLTAQLHLDKDVLGSIAGEAEQLCRHAAALLMTKYN